MCMSASCPDCSKKSWRGCGRHIPSAMSGVPEEEWCTCEPRVELEGKSYPKAARVAAPGFVSGLFGGLMGGGGKEEKKKDEL
ncbi:hypothetical protein M406DRAFT_247507 [Cryphonectria parasitica EP155]|uniref:Uncharacterized protein n=1 Tax=Cryphonectria parasitica (strain ATCC 38755 / EP155) TaxID=660469 RepID=A0A9P4YA80_CRYP1|nr:uncharacterized protein M406DRAFT_247507 [Cryphonectria parasitica EP155]KAF3769678.1 hypothetical protein M406DRAFT_247507 [Cryphonectria parasitica EP155]